MLGEKCCHHPVSLPKWVYWQWCQCQCEKKMFGLSQWSVLLFFKRKHVFEYRCEKWANKRHFNIICMRILKLNHLNVCVNANRDIDEEWRRGRERERMRNEHELKEKNGNTNISKTGTIHMVTGYVTTTRTTTKKWYKIHMRQNTRIPNWTLKTSFFFVCT